MPESPEVNALAEFLALRVTGRRIVSTELEEFRAVKTPARPLREVDGATIAAIERYGKHIGLDLGDRWLIVSFGRAGWAAWTGPAEPVAVPAPVVARLRLDDDSALSLTDAGEWLSLGLSVVDDPAAVPSVAKLGVDPVSADFTVERFEGVVARRRKRLKALLQEQESLAGVGNAYSDEILHVARLSPVAHAAALSPEERTRLFEAVRGVLADAFGRRRSVAPEDQKARKAASMRVHGRSGLPCTVCGDRILDVPGSKGAAQYCPTCQTGGVALEG